jgi:hypothetical protein
LSPGIVVTTVLPARPVWPDTSNADIDAALLAYIEGLDDSTLRPLAAGTSYPELTIEERRKVWLRLVADQERELFAHAHQLCIHEVMAVSLSITRHTQLIRIAPLGMAAIATANVCLDVYHLFAASPFYRGAEWISDRAISVLRSQATMLVGEKRRDATR